MILVKNGTVIDPASNRHGEFDIWIERGRISAIDRRGSFSGQRVQQEIDAQGSLVVPGLIDLHVHLREPGFEWKETIKSGSQAALLGGFTSICCMPNTKPVNHNAEITRFILEQAKAAGAARVLPIGAVSVNSQGKEMAPLSELREAGCVAFSDDGEPIWDSALMRRALEWSAMLGMRISCHEEDKCLSCGGSMNESLLSHGMGLVGMPKLAEEVMVARDIEIARTTKAKVHICHISTGRAVELVRRAKNDGIDITAEVTPHHLMLSENAVGDYDTHAKMSPPLREAEEIEALRAGLRDGTIDAVASD
ncbi:MAG: dihydroorotase, partial [Bdellovibrionales bacterium]|nr:dihydroorotase [Bdellovibrionales bacterium]